ncbi:hypothetical protein Ahy_A10g050644 [Arachis hypogaea]|uniref:Aminotransferase-like plant mobile domain-containing protein n=1 Tax=Arachis hypogaea TaxID=3818 RepID=A0A445B9Y1_ARAHY|nr:hypothetical protein Ahy_A10g050644 [Arachis hypogaea]
MARNKCDMYRLNSIAHVAGFIDEENCIDEFTMSYVWFQNRFRVMPTDATKPMVQVYARGYIMMLLSTILFGDKSGARVHLRWLPYVADLDGLGKYSWGLATLSWLYSPGYFRGSPHSGREDLMSFSGCLHRDEWGRYMPSSDEKGPRFIWMPYSTLEVIQVIYPNILRPEHTHLWKSTTALIYFSSIKWHQVNRVLSQLGGVQHVPEPVINIDFLLLKDGRGPTHWFLRSLPHGMSIGIKGIKACLRFSWYQIHDPLLSILIGAHRFLSHDRDLVDPRQAGIPADAPVRGHIAVTALT